MGKIIAILEDDARRTQAMKQEVTTNVSHAEPVFFDNAPDMIQWLTDNLPEVRLLCLDHDLGPNRRRGSVTFDPGIGRDVVDFLLTRRPSCPVLIHSTNVEGAHGMEMALQVTVYRQNAPL